MSDTGFPVGDFPILTWRPLRETFLCFLQRFAAISIDFPYHGKQARCMGDGGVIEVVDPQTGKVTALPQCNTGSTCNQFGKCVNASDQGNDLAMFPVINTPVASGGNWPASVILSALRRIMKRMVDSLDGGSAGPFCRARPTL